MNILIVHAHPESQSFTDALKDTAIQTLSDAGHQVAVSDLYAMDFNPVASSHDFSARKDSDYLVYALEQRHAYQSQQLAPDILAEIEKVKAADLIILSFPLFWASMPAMLKGWIDRVFVSGLFYGGLRFYDQGGMRGKKAMLSFTLGGQSHMFGEDAIHGPIEHFLQPIQRGMLAYVGFDVLTPFIAYHVPYISHEARQEILQDYQQQLTEIEQRPTLQFPRMEQFDSRLYPKESS